MAQQNQPPDTMSYGEAVLTAILEEMRRDDRVFFMATSPPDELVREFGNLRVRRTPISEATLTGMALGAAAAGLRPIVWWRNATFSFVAFDQIANQAAKLRYMFGAQRDFPVVFRAISGGGLRLAAQHSQSPYAIYAHMPGLKVIVPSTPSDARGLLKSAIRDNNPVICFEPARLETVRAVVPLDEALIPFGKAAITRGGSDVTVVAIGYMVALAMEAAAELAVRGVNVEVVDPRTLVPLDVQTIQTSVMKTGRVVVVDEAPATCSFAAEIAAIVVGDRDTLHALKAPVVRVCGMPVPVPYSPPMEDFVLPSADRIVAAVESVIEQ